MNRHLITLITLVALNACSSPEKDVVKRAGSNGIELQKVLNYFENDSCQERYEAAKFVIRNMPGNFSVDTTMLASYRPFLQEACSLYVEHDKNSAKSEVAKSWELFKENNRIAPANYHYQPDYEIIRSRFLIQDIELAYNAWRNNPYNKNTSFDEFREYVLPYKRKNGLPIESWRNHFWSQNIDHFNNSYPMPLIAACDSLLFRYKALKHNQFMLSDLPLLKVEDFEVLKRGACEHKCWYNSMLFASHGIACAIDFVLAWGNRNAGHSWNVIIQNGESYAFEPFWDKERWKYKRIYNNESFDDEWGKFRLPRVFRHTYSSHPEGPVVDSKVEPSDIPVLFRNLKKRDVSDEYFETENVEIELTNKIPDNTHYAYLCVFGYHQWHPVQWGKISGSKAHFKGMGKDIVYLPCFFKNGKLVYAADPFLLTPGGDVQTLNSDEFSRETVNLNRVNYEFPMYASGIGILGGSRVEISDDPDFYDPELVGVIPDSMLCEMNLDPLENPVNGRFVRLVFQGEIAELSELSFYKKTPQGTTERLTGDIICHKAIDKSEVGKVFDHLVATDFTTRLPVETLSDKTNLLWVGLDFGKTTRIDAIGYSPRIYCNLLQNDPFELFYWKNGWRSIAIKEGTGKNLVFTNVPGNSLLMLKNNNWGPRGAERIFIYQDGEQRWY